MDVIYYISGTLMTLTLIGLIVAALLFLVKPHLLNKSKHINKSVPRTAIAMVALASMLLTMFGFGTVMAATEPASVKEIRAAQAANERQVEQLQEQQAKADAAAEQKRLEEANKPQLKIEIKTAVVPFESIDQQDGTLPLGQTRVSTAGVDGERTVTYQVTYVRGSETARKEIKNEVTLAPVTKVTQIGTYVYVAPPVQQYVAPPTSNSTYTPPVHSTGRVGATCVDDTHSNATGSGACSHHHGVAVWLYG